MSTDSKKCNVAAIVHKYTSAAREAKLQALWREFWMPVTSSSDVPTTDKAWNVEFKARTDQAMAAVLDLPEPLLVECIRGYDMEWLEACTPEGIRVDAISALTLCVKKNRADLPPVEIVLSFLYGTKNTSAEDDPWFTYPRGKNAQEDALRDMRDRAKKHIASKYKNEEDWAAWVVSALRLQVDSEKAAEMMDTLLEWRKEDQARLQRQQERQQQTKEATSNEPEPHK